MGEKADDSLAAPAAVRNLQRGRARNAPMKVLLTTQPLPATSFIEGIRSRAPELALVEYRSSLADADLADVDVVLGWQMPPGLPARLPRLRWVCSIAAGVEKLLVPEL